MQPIIKHRSFTHWVDDDQQSVIRPGSQLHATVLQVKGEMEDNNLTVALKDGRRVPCDHPRVLQQDFSLVDDGKVAVGTAEQRTGVFFLSTVHTFIYERDR